MSALTKVIHFIQYVSSKNYYSDRFLSGICNLLSEHGQVGAFPLTKPDIYKGKPVIKSFHRGSCNLGVGKRTRFWSEG